MLINMTHFIFIPIVYFTTTCLWALFLGSEGDKQAEADAENPKILEENNQQKEHAESPKKNPHQKAQRNYDVVYEIVKMACMNALQYLGRGTNSFFFFSKLLIIAIHTYISIGMYIIHTYTKV